MSQAAWGLYVHVPWCRIRCPYCAFHVDVDRSAPFGAFVDRALAEAAWRREAFGFPGEPLTVYLGGGTPSRLPAAELERLLGGLVGAATAEVTVEANPEDVDAAWLAAALDAGVTRVSLGVQTLAPSHARRLGRAHTPEHARAAAALLAASPLRSWSADLMFALHEQGVDDLARDLDALLALGPPHVSLYGLTIEPGTAYARGHARGAVRPPEDETWRAMYALLVARLEAAGLHRYEVSNFARPGHRSLHNQGYWQDRPYLGVGPSAHGYAPDGRRWVDVADTAAWLTRPDPTDTLEHPTGEAAAIDLLVAGMRSVEGLALRHLAERTGHVPTATARARLAAAGVLREEGGRMMLAPDGFFVADAVVAALADALVPVAPGERLHY